MPSCAARHRTSSSAACSSHCGAAQAFASASTLEAKIRAAIRQHATPRHVPARIVAVDDIPRTKSGKIVEIAVRDVVHGRPVKNQETLANPEALAQFTNRAELAS